MPDIPLDQAYQPRPMPLANAYRSGPSPAPPTTEDIPIEQAYDPSSVMSGGDYSQDFLARFTGSGVEAVAKILKGIEALGPGKLEDVLFKGRAGAGLEEEARNISAQGRDTLAGKIGGIVGGAAVQVPTYALGAGAIGAIPMFAGMGALEKAPEGVIPAIKGAGEGALTGALLGPAGKLGELGTMGKIASVPAQGAVLAGTGALEKEGRTPEALLQNFLTGSAFGAYGLVQAHAGLRQFYKEQAEALGATPEQVRAAGGHRNWLNAKIAENPAEAPAEPVAGQTPQTPAPEATPQGVEAPAAEGPAPTVDRRGDTDIDKAARALSEKVKRGEGTPEEERLVRAYQLNDEITDTPQGLAMNIDSHRGEKVPGRKYVWVDVDSLHNRNKLEGRPGGDALLNRISSLLKDGVHPQDDAVYRPGGDEFAVIAHSKDIDTRMKSIRSFADANGDGFSYGIGETPEEAQAAAEADKAARPAQVRISSQAPPAAAPQEALAPATEAPATPTAAAGEPTQPELPFEAPAQTRTPKLVPPGKEKNLLSKIYETLRMGPKQIDKASGDIAKLAAEAKAKDTGFSYHLEKGDSRLGWANNKFVLSKWRDRGLLLDHDPSAQDIRQFIHDNADVLRDRRNFVGGWTDSQTGQFHLDISTTEADHDTAMSLAKKFGQKTMGRIDEKAQYGNEEEAGGPGTPMTREEGEKLYGPADERNGPPVPEPMPADGSSRRPPIRTLSGKPEGPGDRAATEQKTDDQIAATISEAGKILALKDIPKTLLNQIDMVTDNAHNQIRKWGGPLYDWLYRASVEAHGNSREADVLRRQFFQELRGIIEKAPDIPEEQRGRVSARIGLHQAHLREGGDAILRKMGVQIVDKLTPTEARIEQELYSRYEKIYKNMNVARSMMGLGPMGHIDNYVTFIHNLAKMDRAGKDIWMQDPVRLTKELNDLSFEYAKHWKRSDLAVDLDAFHIYDTYARKAEHYIALAPFKARFDAVMSKFNVINPATGKVERLGLDDTAPNLAKVIRGWGKFALDRSCADPLREMPKGLVNTYTGIFRNIGKATLPFNIRTWLIHLLKGRNIVAEYGWKRTAHGYNAMARKDAADPDATWLEGQSRNLKALNAYQATAEPEEEAMASTGVGGSNRSEFMNKAVKLTKEGAALRDHFSQLGMKPLQFFNMISAEAALHAGYAEAIAPVAEGGRGFARRSPEAVAWADDAISRTQATAAPQDLAMIQRYPIFKPVFMFQTFMVNDFNYLAHTILGINSPDAPSLGGLNFLKAKPNYSKLMRYAVATSVIGAVFQEAMHMRSPYPTPEWEVIHGIANGDSPKTYVPKALKEFLEPIPVVGGMVRWSTPYKKMYPAGIQEMGDLASTGSKIMSLFGDFDLGKFKPEDMSSVARLLGVPGFGEIEKTMRRRQRGMNWFQSIMGIRTDEPSGGFGAEYSTFKSAVGGQQQNGGEIPPAVREAWESRWKK